MTTLRKIETGRLEVGWGGHRGREGWGRGVGCGWRVNAWAACREVVFNILVRLNLFNGELVVSEEVLAGTEFPGGGERVGKYLSLHWHHQNDSCIKTGSDESHLNVSSHKTASTDHNL